MIFLRFYVAVVVDFSMIATVGPSLFLLVISDIKARIPGPIVGAAESLGEDRSLVSVEGNSS
jgi:hypothetical protein